MADPLLISTLIVLTAQIAGKACELYSTAKDAPESVREIQDEMEELNLIFCQIRLLVGSTKEPASKDRMEMISIHHLMTTLRGCVLVCSNLDQKLDEVRGLRQGVTTLHPKNTAQKGASTVRVLHDRIKWALWTSDEVAEILEDLQRHKLSLNLMLNIIQCNQGSEAAKSLAQLHEIVAKILDSNHTISCQLRELIKRQDTCEAGAVSSTDLQQDSPEISVSIQAGGSTSVTLVPRLETPTDFDDGTSTRATASTFSMRAFTDELLDSKVYKRLDPTSRRWGWSSSPHCTLSANRSPSVNGDSWSILAAMSLGALSTSAIPVLELPVCLSDLYDTAPYAQALRAQSSSGGRRASLRIRWVSQPGRLHKHVKKKDVFTVRILLACGADIEERDVHGFTPLHHAADSGDNQTCKLLMDRGANVDSKDSAGRTPLSYGVEKGNTESCQLLMDRDADVDSKDSAGRTPVSYAAGGASYQCFVICGILLDRGATVDSTDSAGRTPLSYAAEKGHSGSCQLLIDRGANVELKDSAGRTPLSYAAEQGRTGFREILMDRGAHADVDSKDSAGRTPLFYAVEQGHTEFCGVLLDKGVDVNSTG